MHMKCHEEWQASPVVKQEIKQKVETDVRRWTSSLGS